MSRRLRAGCMCLQTYGLRAGNRCKSWDFGRRKHGGRAMGPLDVCRRRSPEPPVPVAAPAAVKPGLPTGQQATAAKRPQADATECVQSVGPPVPLLAPCRGAPARAKWQGPGSRLCRGGQQDGPQA